MGGHDLPVSTDKIPRRMMATSSDERPGGRLAGTSAAELREGLRKLAERERAEKVERPTRSPLRFAA